MGSLITGVTGFVGSHLAELLIKKGEKVFGITRWRSSLKNIEEFKDKLELLECDLKDLSSVANVVKKIKPDYIYHLAAQSYVPASFANPKETVEDNLIGTLNLLEAVRILDQKPIIHICSTSDVYGEVKNNEVPIRETNPLRPISPYAISKAAADMMARGYFLSYGIKTVRTRAFNITGPRRGEVFAESSFAKQIAEIEKGLRKPEIIVGNLKSVRTFADVRDIARAYWLVVRRGKPGEVYNIAGNATVTISKILDILISLSPMAGRIKVKVDPSLFRPVDSVSRIPDDRKFRKISGWKTQIPIEKSLEDLLNFWRTII